MKIECSLCGEDMDWVETDLFICQNSECGNRASYDHIFPATKREEE